MIQFRIKVIKTLIHSLEPRNEKCINATFKQFDTNEKDL